MCVVQRSIQIYLFPGSSSRPYQDFHLRARRQSSSAISHPHVPTEKARSTRIRGANDACTFLFFSISLNPDIPRPRSRT